MNADQKTKEQLLAELAHSQELLEQEQRRADLERERSLALQEVSKRVAAAHDTDEVLDLIVNEAARLLNATGAWMRLLDTRGLARGVTTKAVAGFYEELLAVNWSRIPSAISVGILPDKFDAATTSREFIGGSLPCLLGGFRRVDRHQKTEVQAFVSTTRT